MEQIFLRFPHLAEGIFEKLNNKTLANCKVVSRSWKASIDDFKFTWIRALKNSSKDSLIRMLKSQLDLDKVKSIAMGTQELELKKKEEAAKRLLKVRNAQLSQNVPTSMPMCFALASCVSKGFTSTCVYIFKMFF